MDEKTVMIYSGKYMPKPYNYFAILVVVVSASAYLWYSNTSAQQPSIEDALPTNTISNSETKNIHEPQRIEEQKSALEPLIKEHKVPQEATNSPVSRHEISGWRASRGLSEDQRVIYESYSNETLLELATEGDIFALQELYYSLEEAGSNDLAIRSLHEAAARGSVEALNMMARHYANEIDFLNRGYKTEENIIEKYQLSSSPFSVRDSLTILSASHFLTTAIRGDIEFANLGMDYINKYVINGTIKEELKPSIYKNARKIYESIQQERKTLNLGEFDNSYPEVYARRHGLPKENNMLKQMCKYLDDCSEQGIN